MPDMGTITGGIALLDDFTNGIQKALDKTIDFVDTIVPGFGKAAAVAAGLTAALGATAAAVAALGSRGADVNDVAGTLDHFSGSAKLANDNLQALRAGTQGTVDDFTLMKDASHVLSAGVKLSADDFSTLSQAAFVLQNRGLGPTKDMLGLVSDSLVTGRTRALSMALGVIDAGDAEEEYAKKLGIKKEMLSEEGKVQAKRIAVMDILKQAVADAGEQELDFGEMIEVAQTRLLNWIDSLGSAIATSPALVAGMKAAGEALQAAFGGDTESLITTIVEDIKSVAIFGTYFAQGMIEASRVVHTAWAVIETGVLAVGAALSEAIALVLAGISKVTGAAAAVPGAPQWLKDTAEVTGHASEAMDHFTDILIRETAEASKGVTGHSTFDGVLDKLSGTLFHVRDALEANDATQQKNNESTGIAAKNAKVLAEAQEELNKRHIDQQKVLDALTKSTKELNDTWNDYFVQVAKNSGTSRDAQIASIEAVFNKQVEALDAFDPLYEEKYAAYRQIADEATENIGLDWDRVKDRSIEGLQEQADAALALYNKMAYGSLTFRREELDAQLQKYRELQAEANGWGSTVQKNIDETANHIQILDHAWVTDSDIAEATINKTTIMVKTLSGELISLKEAQDRLNAPVVQQLQGRISPLGGQLGPQQAPQIEREIMDLERRIAEYQEDKTPIMIYDAMSAELARQRVAAAQQHANDVAQLEYLKKMLELIERAMKSTAHFQEGGTVWVGESGPELVRLPLGSTVYPHGSLSSSANGLSGGGAVVNFAPGAFQFHYPIMNDRRALNNLGQIIERGIITLLQDRGVHVGG